MIIQPKYSCILPSDSKKIEFRPFVVSEEKALLLAIQEGDIDSIADALHMLLSVCTDGVFDSKVRPFYDSEFLFLKIRSKAIGEVLDLVGKCECNEQVRNEFTVDIDDMRVEPTPSSKDHFKIDGTSIYMKFRHPSLFNFLEHDDTNSVSILASCITEIYDDDEQLDLSIQKKLELLNSMTSKQQGELKKFLADMPAVKLDASYKCKACSKEHNYVLSGFENFFV